MSLDGSVAVEMHDEDDEDKAAILGAELGQRLLDHVGGRQFIIDQQPQG